MYLNIHTNEIVNEYPSPIVLSNGSIISGDNLDPNILADAGYYTIRNDEPPRPNDASEDVANRFIALDKPYVDIIRVWNTQVGVPNSISARQVRLWLIDNDISLSDVDNAIDSIPDPKLRDKTRVEWEYAPYIERTHPLLDALASNLGLTSEQIDLGFIAASLL